LTNQVNDPRLKRSFKTSWQASNSLPAHFNHRVPPALQYLQAQFGDLIKELGVGGNFLLVFLDLTGYSHRQRADVLRKRCRLAFIRSRGLSRVAQHTTTRALLG
jgi:hypothetical protein